MMDVKVKINLYDVLNVGYYSKELDEHAFCDLSDLLHSLKEWAGRQDSIQFSKTFDKEQYKNQLPVYCVDIIQDPGTKDFLLTTWNETPSENGNYASINLRSGVGTYDINISDIPEGNVPGYATYFWFLPEKNKFSTIRFNNTLNGHPGLQLYLRNYLRSYSPYVIHDNEAEGDYNIVGYSNNGEEGDEKIIAKFESVPSVTPADIEYLKKNVSNIKKVLRKSRMNYLNMESEIRKHSLLSGLFNTIGIGTNFPKSSENMKIRLEMDVSLDKDQLAAIYNHWENELKNGDSFYEDIGFRIRNSSEDHWLSRTLKKKEFEIKVREVNQEVFDGKSLLDALLKEVRPEVILMM